MRSATDLDSGYVWFTLHGCWFALRLPDFVAAISAFTFVTLHVTLRVVVYVLPHYPHTIDLILPFRLRLFGCYLYVCVALRLPRLPLPGYR